MSLRILDVAADDDRLTIAMLTARQHHPRLSKNALSGHSSWPGICHFHKDLLDYGVIGSMPLKPQVNTMAWKIVGAADYDKDGISDIVWQNTANKQVNVWHMNGDGSRKSSFVLYAGNAKMDAEWEVVAVGNLTASTYTYEAGIAISYNSPDLVWRHKTKGWNSVWLYTPDHKFIKSVPLKQGASSYVAPKYRIIGLDDTGAKYLYWYDTETGTVIAWLLSIPRAEDAVTATQISKSKGATISTVNPAKWELQFASGLNGGASLFWKDLSNPTQFTKWNVRRDHDIKDLIVELQSAVSLFK